MAVVIIGYQRTNDEFLREMKENNRKVKVLGEYTKARNKIEEQCVDCGDI